MGYLRPGADEASFSCPDALKVLMSEMPIGATPPAVSGDSADPPAHLRIVPPHEHTWSLRDTEYEDGHALRRFECACGSVTFD